MNQNIKSFEEFKKIYTSNEFKDILKKAYKVKKQYQKLVIITLLWGIPAILFMILAPLLGIVTMIFGIIIEYFIFGRKMILTYPTFYRTQIPQVIAKLSEIEVKTVDVAEEEFFSEDDYKDMSAWDEFKTVFKAEFNGTSKTRQYEKKLNQNIAYAKKRNTKQFKDSGIVNADEYRTSNIAQFKHKDTDTNIDFYYATAIDVETIKRRKRSDADNYTKADKYITYTERKEKVLTSGVVFTFENLYNINIKDYRILIKDDDTLISHLTENTIDSIKENKNEIKFNRIDLNKSFDFLVLANDKNKDVKIDALQIVTPVVEDLIAYIRKKYGRFNMAINNNKIDIELLNTSIVGGNKKHYKDIIIKPKVFSSGDLKISYLYRFYELIEIQKLILKYLNCFPEKYLITEEDVNGLREAIESKKLSDYEMDNSVKAYFKEIIGGV